MEPVSNQQTVQSPCIKTCTLDPKTGLCLGCYRNMEEIINWMVYDQKEKQEILNRIEIRKRK